MAVVGALRVDLGLNSAEFQAGMSKAEASMTNFGKTAANVGKAANDVGRMTAGVMQRQAQLGFQLQDLAVQIQGGANPFTALLQQGSQVQAVYSGQGGLAQAFRDMGSMALGLVTKFAPFLAIIGGVTAGFGLMAAEINKTKGETVSLGDVAVASFQVIADGVYGVIRPAVEAIGGFFSNLWSTISPYIAMAANGIIGGFVGAFEAIKATWAQLPAALGDLAIQAAQGVINVFTDMGQKIVTGLNQTIFAINSKFGASLPTLGVPYKVVPGALLDNPFAGAAAGVGNAAKDAFAGAQGDYLGDFMSAVGERARANIAATKTEVDGLGGSAKAANDNLKGMATDGLSAAAQQAESLGNTIKDAFKGFVTDIKEGKNWLEALGGALNKVADRLLDMALDGLFSVFTGGGGGLGGLLGGLFGFANGGQFKVGGSGGIDSQLVAFKASPNETVSITKPGQERAGGSMNVHITTDDDRFRASMRDEAGNVVAQSAPAIVGTAVNQSGKQAPAAIARYQNQVAGGDYRLG